MCQNEINQIRLNVNCTVARSWCEIDCIQLIGHRSDIGVFYKDAIKNFETLLNNNSLSDVTFQLDNGQSISAHRNILSIRCIYFNELFAEYPLNTTESIRIRNISYEAFYQILHFIYTDTLEPVVTYDVCLELMRNADEFFLSPIYTKAFNILKTTINKANVIKIFMHSGLFPSTSDNNEQDHIPFHDVVDICVGFIRQNRQDIYCQDDMQQLTKDMLLKLVQLVL